MLLKNLIKNIPKKKGKITIKGLSTNSKEVKNGYIFFAIKGNKVNGENYINEAIINGATVIVCSHNCKYKNKKIYIIKKKNIRFFLSEISSKFFKIKSRNIIAVTGTNGKTSVADLFYQILSLNNVPVASIGTLGIKYKNNILKTGLTSPDTISIHKSLKFLKKNKIDNVIIEASSHGLDQNRLHHINFKAAIFTNFSQDHLDYHGTMKSYFNSKLILFKKILKKNSVIIVDKNINEFLTLKKIAKNKKLKVIGIESQIKKINNISTITKIEFKNKNLAMSIEAAKLCGLNSRKIFKSLNKIKDINGRLELVRTFPNNIKVFIDYAHTPDALSKVLQSLTANYGNNISLVFGCGGDRDKKKRPLMAMAANNYSKKIYVTDDNPRNENPKKIRDEIIKKINPNKCFNIGNRTEAIKKAIKNSKQNEIILIAGKGHEDKQIYRKKVFYISDKQIVKNIRLKIKKLTIKEQNYSQNKSILNKIKKNTKLDNFNGLAIDSRMVKKNNLFLTIDGKNSDGSKFIPDAIKRGAKYIVSSEVKNKYRNKIIKVKNEISFLNQFAYLKRQHSLAKIIAITGSAGKTTLKNLIKQLLENFENTHASPRSFNNHFGVPISLSNLSNSDKFGVFEVGMSKAGEIRNLSKIIKPDIGVITNIGEAHLENFKNVKGIAQAKSEIIENIKVGGTIVLNRDDKYFKFLFRKAKLYKLKTLTFGVHEKSDIFLKKAVKKGDFSQIYINTSYDSIKLKIRDLNIYNVLASLAVLSALKINLKKVISKFKNFELSEGRGKKHYVKRYKKKFIFIDESYNANPLSVKNAINNLSSIKKENFKKYLILGDMLELGSKSKKYHQELSKVINNSDIDKVFIKGKKTIFTYKHLYKDKRGNILQNNEDIDFSLSKMISNNDYLMIKGSNATGLNTFSKKMIKGY